jgi:hypothetical protein
MLGVIMLSVTMVSVVLPSITMLSAFKLNAITLNVVVPTWGPFYITKLQYFRLVYGSCLAVSQFDSLAVAILIVRLSQ